MTIYYQVKETVELRINGVAVKQFTVNQTRADNRPHPEPITFAWHGTLTKDDEIELVTVHKPLVDPVMIVQGTPR